MQLLKVAGVVGAALLLFGCGGPAPKSSSYVSATPASVASSVPSNPTIKSDSYKPVIEVQTTLAQRGSPTSGGTEGYVLAGTIDRATGASQTYVQWFDVYAAKEWRFYISASSSKGQSYEFRQVSRNVTSCSRYSGCVYNESYNIYIPQADMRAGATRGVSFKIYSKTGEERVIDLPADLIAEFNQKMAEAAKLRGK